MALVQQKLGARRRSVHARVCGAALFYGDSIITPAISVLSAVEGLKLVTPFRALYPSHCFGDHHRPLRRAEPRTGSAKFFGPIMIVWFLTLAVLASARSRMILISSGLQSVSGCKFLFTHGMAGSSSLVRCFCA